MNEHPRELSLTGAGFDAAACWRLDAHVLVLGYRWHWTSELKPRPRALQDVPLHILLGAQARRASRRREALETAAAAAELMVGKIGIPKWRVWPWVVLPGSLVLFVIDIDR